MVKILAVIGCWCAIGGFILLILSPNLVIAETFKSGLDSTANKTGHPTSGAWAPGGLPGAIGKVIGRFLAVLGVAFLGLIIYGGVTWMLARGNDQDITKARDLITSAIIGLIVILGAYAITIFIGAQIVPSAVLPK